ncbi:hypothetical protein NQ314_012278 [Rhamnusium bicolor]|uniref:Glycine-rich protein n=1 Tax=Rhamnusium bicolor TaxID=1586634 RepID=A0AAV8XDK4_9CUCU|nr:hypothetical protein NQ314_012278 [Rhamnusium bicolor]
MDKILCASYNGCITTCIHLSLSNSLSIQSAGAENYDRFNKFTSANSAFGVGVGGGHGKGSADRNSRRAEGEGGGGVGGFGGGYTFEGKK